uniref:Uncharacterized protein n=1 Tax=Solanum lycopersicum TaxID=4081 RepID=A0A3Q7IDK7_SOLLC
VVLRPALH